VKHKEHPITRKFVALVLLAAVSFFFSPKELVNDFFHHDDTKDLIAYAGTGQQIENLHQHCDLLQFSVPPVIHHVGSFSFANAVVYCMQPANNTGIYYPSYSSFLFFRGPPSIV